MISQCISAGFTLDFLTEVGLLVDVPSMEIFKVRLDRALSSLR